MSIRFSIRDFAWLVLVLSLVLAWRYDRASLKARNRFTVDTYHQGEPEILKDNATGRVLIKREGEIWWVAEDPKNLGP